MILASGFTDEELAQFSPDEVRYLRAREGVLRAAVEDAFEHDVELRDALLEGRPIWRDTFAPLTSGERTMVLVEVCKRTEIPLPGWLQRAVAQARQRARDAMS